MIPKLSTDCIALRAGTTVFGAIDPVVEIVQICKKYGIWCHVDGMFGGMLIMSDKYARTKLTGVEG